MAAASGISVLASSGDDGSTACVDSSGVPEVPAGGQLPGLVAVGDRRRRHQHRARPPPTTLQAPGRLERADGAGGGGYSILFKPPVWQTGLHHRPAPGGARRGDARRHLARLLRSTARPRATAQHAPPAGPWGEFGGTSAGTPLLAGGLALIDEGLRKNGRQDIGLANPLLLQGRREPVRSAGVQGRDRRQQRSVRARHQRRADGRLLYRAARVRRRQRARRRDPVEPVDRGQRDRAKLVNVGVSLPTQRHPVRDGHLLARVSCSGRCLMGAYAKIRSGRSRRS